MVDRINLDYEGGSNAVLTGAKSVGIHNYMRDPSTRPFLAAWSINGEPIEQIDFTEGDTLPPEVVDALTDPHVEKWAFNAAFERLFTRIVLGIKTPIKGWRCSMALAYMRSFTGGLDSVGTQIGLPASMLKDPIGDKLIKLFCMPQRITKNQPLLWRDSSTDPDDWQRFREYNVRDVASEMGVYDALIRYPLPPEEWELYEIDQAINDRGLPVDMDFVRNADLMATRRRAELTSDMAEITSLANPNSGHQLLPWLKERGYPFSDLQKNTLKKVLTENESGDTPDFLDGAAVAVLKLRQQASRTSVKKYPAIQRRVSYDFRLRHCFQFAGAQRTNRWSGRGPQPQNLVKTPKQLEPDNGSFAKLEAATDAIRTGDYDLLGLVVDEPMVALAGCLRSSFRAPPGYEFIVCDLSAIESAVGGWLTGCKRMLRVFELKLDPYRDFGTELYNKPYDQITKEERNICKPPTLGCGFGLGGGRLFNGKRTGLWGYAENMGVDITREEADRQVKLFRAIYPEIPACWRALEDGFKVALRGEQEISVNRKLLLTRRGRFMTMRLPSGRLVFYDKPKMMTKEFPSKDGGTYTRNVFTCMGKSQITNKWGRIVSGGPKLFENAVQATAREVLGTGVRRAARDGFKIVGTVHDEIIALRKKGDNYFTLERLREHMIEPIKGFEGLPLNAAGYVSDLYKKD